MRAQHVLVTAVAAGIGLTMLILSGCGDGSPELSLRPGMRRTAILCRPFPR